MPGTYTSRLGLYKPDGDDNVNEITDLNNNYDRLDALVSFVPVTLSTYPASGYHGQAFYETDTGKAYVNASSSASTITKRQLLVAGASFDSNITLASSAHQVAIGGTGSTAAFAAMAGTTAGFLFSGRSLTASANSMFTGTVAGVLGWGPGSSTVDVTFYRDSAGVLGTDGSITAAGDLLAGDTVYGVDAELSGEARVNGATLRPQLHSVISHSNSTTEKAIQTITIPANDAVVGATYRIRLFGTCVVTGTPTINFRIRMGDQVTGDNPVTLGAITCRSGMADGYWTLEALLTCTASPGATATWYGVIELRHNFVGSATTYAVAGPVVGTVTKDSTAAFDFHLVADWGTASPSNIIVARGGESGRVG